MKKLIKEMVGMIFVLVGAAFTLIPPFAYQVSNIDATRFRVFVETCHYSIPGLVIMTIGTLLAKDVFE